MAPDRIRVLACVVIVSSVFMIAVFAAASGQLPADAKALLGQMSICRSS